MQVENETRGKGGEGRSDRQGAERVLYGAICTRESSAGQQVTVHRPLVLDPPLSVLSENERFRIPGATHDSLTIARTFDKLI